MSVQTIHSLEYNQSSTSSHVTPVNGIPGYHFIRELGHGAQGQVLLAERESDGRKVAIKKLNINSVKNWKEYELFHREADTLASLDIDGVAHFYEAIERLEDNPPCSYLVQEYIHGKSLNDMIKMGHRFSLDIVYDILMQLIMILYQLHTHQPPVIHRDIKPSNILLTPVDNRYKVYLIDFGAVANPQVQGGGSTVAGTYGYMPPEQLMGKPEPASDIYSIAAVGVYLITGRSPADMPTKDFHLIFEPDMQNMPPAVVNTLRSMLEPAPQKRLCDYEHIYNLLEAFQNDIYEYTGSRQKLMSSSRFEYELKNVQYYGQPGNIELWQELSDILPRNDIPIIYKYIAHRITNLNSDGKFIFENSSFENSPLKYQETPSTAIAIIGVCFLFYLIIGLLFMPIPTIIVFAVIASIITVFVAFMTYLSERNEELFRKIKTFFLGRSKIIMPVFDESYKQTQDSVDELLKNGRKSIATIISIEYLKLKNEYIETNLFYPKNEKQVKDYYNKAKFACHTTPLFRIGYKFNPPDDESIEDLIHYITVPIEPENHYKVGDPFPILYRIYRIYEYNNGIHGHEYVDSMPFPIPLDSICGYDSILYHKAPNYLQLFQDIYESEYK